MPITPLPDSRAKLCLNVVLATETAVAKSEATFASVSGRDRVSARARAVQLDASPQLHAPRSIGPARRLLPISICGQLGPIRVYCMHDQWWP